MTGPTATNSDGSATFKVSGIPLGDHTFQIKHFASNLQIFEASGQGTVSQNVENTVALGTVNYMFDQDHDGILNLEELRAGTDPTSTVSPGPAGLWTTTGSLSTDREDSDLTVISSGAFAGKVLVNGGCCFAPVSQVYNPDMVHGKTLEACLQEERLNNLLFHYRTAESFSRVGGPISLVSQIVATQPTMQSFFVLIPDYGLQRLLCVWLEALIRRHC